jgi:hypothetical protein
MVQNLKVTRAVLSSTYIWSPLYVPVPKLISYEAQ